MPAAKPHNPVDDLPSGQKFLEVIGALEPYEKNELVKETLKRLRHDYEVHKKEFTELIREQEEAFKHAENHPKQVLDLPAMQKTLGKESRALESLLEEHVPAAKLGDLHKKYNGTLAVAEALVKLAQAIDDEAVKALARKVEKNAEKLTKTQERVDAGGHAVFDDHVGKVARQLWLSLDDGYAVLEMSLRRAGVAYDPILAGQPTQKSPFRPQVALKDPNKPPEPKKDGSKGGNKGKNGGSGSDSGGSSTPSGDGKPTS